MASNLKMFSLLIQELHAECSLRQFDIYSGQERMLLCLILLRVAENDRGLGGQPEMQQRSALAWTCAQAHFGSRTATASWGRLRSLSATTAKIGSAPR